MDNTYFVWTAICVCLVFFMQAGFTLIECGSARSKNVVNTLMKKYMGMSISAIVFWGAGYGLMFGKSNGWFGMDNFLPDNLKSADFISLAYQMMLASIAITIFSGAVSERIHYWSYLLFCIITTGLIYPIFGSWVWNTEGWLASLGFVDFAGATVVHSIGAWCALAGVIVIGPRLGRFSRTGEVRDIPGHNLPLIALGGFILWFGWFGFNAGGITDLDNDLGNILLNTHLGGSAGVIGTLVFMSSRRKPLFIITTINGGLAGLVSVTAGAAILSPSSAIIVGFISGIIYGITAILIEKFRLDDMIGAISVHGFCGAWGTLAIAIFPTSRSFDSSQLIIQLFGILIAFVWAFGISFIILSLIDKTVGLRCSTIHEQHGLDCTEHYELGYPEFQETLTSKSMKN